MRADAIKRQSGQSVLEYVLLMVVIAGLGSLVMAFMPRLFNELEAPLRKNYRFTYQYGFPDACGFDNDDCGGTPKKHIRYDMPGNFRMFGRGQ